MMEQYFLAETATRDKLVHQGIFYKPSRHGKHAILLVHGLTSNFYGDVTLLEEFARQCRQTGFGFAVFNNRGHDMVTGIRKIDRRKKKGYGQVMGGAGLEDFGKSVYDIEAGVDFLAKQGFSQVVLVGHSTGANKVCYYAATKRNPHVKGIVLASPLSDRLGVREAKKFNEVLAYMRKLVKQGKGDELLTGYHFFPITPKRFLSLFSLVSSEDTFDYGEAVPKLHYFSQIKKPLLVILGSDDEYADRPVEKIIGVFEAHAVSRRHKSLVIPGASHGFQGKDREVVREIIHWANEII